MKKLLSLIVLATAPIVAAENGAMTDAERAYLLEQMETSKKNFITSIEGVSAAQWNFKPAPNVWSIAECAEHIVLAEDYIFGFSQQVLKAPAADRLPTANAEADQKLVAAIKDRSHKATAPEPITPSGKFATPADAISAFSEKRDKHIAYVKETTGELRAHSGPGPVGPMDAYQILLLLSAHSERHTAQIQEVQANPGYPKESASR